MLLRKNTPESLKKDVANREWYHQRFDGSPMFIYIIAEAETALEARKPKGTEARLRICFFHDERADWYLDMADVQKGASVIVEKAKKDHTRTLSTKLIQRWKADEEKFEKLFEKSKKISLRTLSDQALHLWYIKTYKAAVRRLTSSAIIDHFALGTDEYISELIKKEVGSLERMSYVTDIFSTATAPVYQSFINTAEIDLMRIALLTRAKQKKELEKYQQNYFWVHNNYTTSKVLSIADFSRELENWKKLGTKMLKEKIAHVKETPSRNKTKKKALFAKYHFSQLLRSLLKISEDFTQWQDERKRATYLNIHIGAEIMREMGRRRGVGEERTRFLLPPEVEQWFIKKTISEDILRDRQKECAFVV